MKETIDDITNKYREMCYAIRMRTKLDNVTGAFFRRQLGWTLMAPEAERERIRKEAADLVKGIETQFAQAERLAAKGYAQDAKKLRKEIFEANADAALIEGARTGRAPFDAIEKRAVADMERLAKSLPVWAEFGVKVRGFGAKGLAVIVGEAGDLAGYSNVGKLYKRFGLAPYDGMAMSTWRWDPKARKGEGQAQRGSLAAEDWVEAGYSPRRRAAIWAYIGDPLFKQGPYADLYQMRRPIENAKCPDKQTQHRRAKRYVEKRLLRDLWNAWNGEPWWLPSSVRPDGEQLAGII